ncbi:PqiC family protein [Rariglobus hedericola]|uniref:Membrane integrity-associated transporter subunit PqiC n=1 Tax=Rariglobus hedericola TaxID=2597822 RepID=A0A556QSN4_9BACT|nr:PqiC family protein [Rariglobus hedericola]TSJ79633.1 membrane integrity-associated transporter subunit PqiC [Rariglobus hedericola]
MNFTSRLRRISAVRLLSCVVLSSVVLSLAGCSLVPAPASDPTRYYVLTGTPSEVERPAKTGELVLGLKRIEIAPYLNGKDMVVREGGNEIAYQSFARWAEPLTTSIGRTVAGRLARADKVSRVYAQPFSFEVERDYDVSIRVFRCEGERQDGKSFASFSALVEVTEAKPAGAIILRKVFTAPETEWDGKNFSALASALSESVAALTAEVVAALPAK